MDAEGYLKAIDSGDKESTYLFLKLDISPHIIAQIKGKMESPFSLAIYKGANEIVEIMIRKSDTSYQNATSIKKGWYNALETENLNIVHAMMTKFGDYDFVNTEGALEFAVKRERENLFNHLLGIGMVEYGRILLIVGEMGNLKAMSELLKKGANINYKNSANVTPLIQAVRNKRLDMARYLIEQGADINIRTTMGLDVGNLTALGYAKKEGQQDMVDLLEKHGAKE